MSDYELIEKNDDFLVINKRAGILVHGAPHLSGETTLADELTKKFPEIISVGEDPFRPGIVHRLDKHVSGLMVIARSQTSFESLKDQFKNRKINKVYTALVHGKIKNEGCTIDFPIIRSSKGHKMAAMPKTNKGEPNQTGRSAITEFYVRQRFINFTLIDIMIKTGRTHQIRAHMAAYGHPVVGDDLYGTRKTKDKNKKLNTSRVFLVSTGLAFKDLRGKLRSFAASLPAEFEQLLKIIK